MYERRRMQGTSEESQMEAKTIERHTTKDLDERLVEEVARRVGVV